VIANAPEIDRVFVLRFWIEACDDLDVSHWRVRINDVNTGRRFHAEGVEGACNVVRSLLLAGEMEENGS
jgi:hypothetical protein